VNSLGIAARVLAAAPQLFGPRRHRDRACGQLAGLTGPVEVLRDRWGVPHVYASNESDLFLVQGYLHARERLWQMELQRRLALGRLAAVLGPAALDSDRLVRILGLRRVAEQEATGLEPDVAAPVEAYVCGVNAYLAEPHRLPLELRAFRFRPRPWTVADVLALGKLMGLLLSGNWATELLRANVVAAVGVEVAARSGMIDADLAPQALEEILRAAAAEPAVRDLPVELEHLLRPGSELATGSNCWVVGGSRSTSGAPLLACDPHLNLQVPSVWFENHLVAGDFSVTGASLPGAPGVVIGHNEELAWGVTNARVDVQDVFVERVVDDRYLTEDGWRPLEYVRELIEVRGRAPHVERVALTRNGPIVTALARDSAVPGGGGELALRWSGAEPGPVVGAVLSCNRARDWAEFRAAFARWTCPPQNVLYADRAGNIGYLLAGTMPVRTAGDGSVPSPGWTGTYGWRGAVAAPDLPHVLNPDSDVLVSANDGPRGETSAHLPGEYLADYRARRIGELIAEHPVHDVDSFARMQSDRLSIPGRELVALAGRLPADTDGERAARDLLADWDCVLDEANPAGSIYWFLRTALVKEAHAEIAEPLGFRAGIGTFSWQPGVEFLEQHAVSRVLAEVSDEVLARAWRAALAELRGLWGDDPANWAYGRWHRLTLRHPLGAVPLLGRRLNPGAFATGGDLDTVCSGHLVTRSDGSHAYGGASYRMVCDLADWDRARSIHLPGQSGVPGDPHYADLVAAWRRGAHHPMPWSRAAVEEVLEHREELVA
jgi:penicillin amidase